MKMDLTKENICSIIALSILQEEGKECLIN